MNLEQIQPKLYLYGPGNDDDDGWEEYLAEQERLRLEELEKEKLKKKDKPN